jgi:pimeloyl-ACP methyl ester carboxylesterase
LTGATESCKLTVTEYLVQLHTIIVRRLQRRRKWRIVGRGTCDQCGADLPSVERGLAEVNGTRLYFETAGRGAPLVLIHGSGLDCRMWEPQFRVFSERFQVIRYDLRGHGRSAVPGREPYVHALDLEALLDHLGVARAHLVGLSRGGATAISFAILNPGSVLGLVLVDSRPEGWSGSPALGEHLRAVVSAARSGDMDAARRLWRDHPLFAPAMRRPEVAARLEEVISGYSGWHWVNDDPARRPEPLPVQRLGEVLAPTLIVVGELDVPDFHEIAETMRREIPRAAKVVISGAGHLPNMEEPDRFNLEVLDFLRRIEDGAPRKLR